MIARKRTVHYREQQVLLRNLSSVVDKSLALCGVICTTLHYKQKQLGCGGDDRRMRNETGKKGEK